MPGSGSAEGADSRYERERSFHDERFGDEVGRRADGFYGVAREWSERYAHLLEPVGHGQRVLEYGCGTGSSAYDLVGRGAEVVGIDISPVAIAQATAEAEERELTGATFLEMNAEKLEFEDASFDVVCGSGILHHLDLDRALDEVRRVLKPGGFAVFGEPMGHNPAINMYRRITPSERTEDEHPLLQSDLDALHDRFDQVDCSFFVLTALSTLPLRRWRHFEAMRARMARLDHSIFTRFPVTRRFAWTVIVELRDPKPR